LDTYSLIYNKNSNKSIEIETISNCSIFFFLKMSDETVPSLMEERSRPSFPPKELTLFLEGSQAALAVTYSHPFLVFKAFLQLIGKSHGL
jgi:hypothetical protein